MLCGVELENLLFDIHIKENRKPSQFVEIGTKTMSILNKQTHLLEISQDKSDHFRKEYLISTCLQ